MNCKEKDSFSSNNNERTEYGMYNEEIKYDENGRIIFEELDLEFLKERFRLSKLTCVNDILYIATSMDEYYVKYQNKELVLFHKNAFKNTKGFHKEHRKFDSIFSVLGYCKHHYYKHKGLGHHNKYSMTRMERLFAQISAS